MQIVPSSSWLYPEEQAEVVRRLLEWGLIRFSNARDLPLKSGGHTDVYINLREARSTPEAIRFISGLFSHPIRRLSVDRFVEVPDAVSCFAELLAVETGMGYITIRQQAKAGRVADARVIGEANRDEAVCIFDDVITDGASKVVPLLVCKERGLGTRAIVVLVDRQQGWRITLAEHGVPVWAGMTLHDVRRHLVMTLSVMERCPPEVEAANPIVVALDGRSWEEILPIIEQLRTIGCILKVNDLVFGEGIDHLLPELAVYGRVMVDLKLHDIPNTVTNTCARLRRHEPWAVTVHASGSGDMVQAAVKALEGTSTKVLAVTVLTSIDPDTCETMYGRRPLEEVVVLAKLAREGGAHGFVCSPEEVGTLREQHPEATLVVPGVRSPGVDAGDQRRVTTPRLAMDRGADHVVMGRQVFGADDPVAEVRRVLSEELEVVLA